MSKKNNSEKDDMNDFDPYNFFKLSGPDDNKNNKNKNKKPRRNFSFLGFLLLLLIVLTVVQLNFPGKLSVSEVEFSRFREMVIDGQIVYMLEIVTLFVVPFSCTNHWLFL